MAVVIEELLLVTTAIVITVLDGIAWKEKKLDLNKELVNYLLCLQFFFCFQIKTTGHITPLMGHCLRNGYNGENDPTL